MKIVDAGRRFALKQFLTYICLVIILFYLSGCARRAVVTRVLDLPPSAITMPSPSQVKSSKFYKVIPLDLDATWAQILRVLVRSAIIVKAREGENLIYFIEIDGFYHQGKLYFAEFPMVVHLEESDDNSTGVRIFPVSKSSFMPEETKLKNPYIRAQDTKAIEFLDRLGAEMTGKLRWPWLWNDKRESDAE